MRDFAAQIFIGALVELFSLVLSYSLKDKRNGLIIFALGTIVAGLIAFGTPIALGISFILALIGLFGFIIRKSLVASENRKSWMALGVMFMVSTLFFCGVGSLLYLRNPNLLMLPVPGIGVVDTPATSPVSLSDDFNNPENNQGYDSNLWSCDGCETNDTRTENGSLRFGVDGESHTEVISYATFQPDHIRYLEGKLKMSEYEGQVAGEVHVMLHTELTSGWWQAVCSIQGPTPEYYCAIMKGVAIQPTLEYITRYVPVKFGEWHTAKIELNPNSFELRFYFDDKLLGAVTPADASELQGKTFTTQFGISSYFQSRHIVAYVDDIHLSTNP